MSDVCFITNHVAYTSSNKTKIVWIETEPFLFQPWVDAGHVYMHAWALGRFYSHISTQTILEGPDRIGGQLRGDKECPFSDITKSGRVWRKVLESARCSECGSVDRWRYLVGIKLTAVLLDSNYARGLRAKIWKRTRPRAHVQNQHTRELISARNT